MFATFCESVFGIFELVVWFGFGLIFFFLVCVLLEVIFSLLCFSLSFSFSFFFLFPFFPSLRQKSKAVKTTEAKSPRAPSPSLHPQSALQSFTLLTHRSKYWQITAPES